MTPEAWKIPTGEVSLPREYFEHAHENGSNEYPPTLTFEESAFMYWKCPTSWAGFSLVRLWFRGLANDATVPLVLVIRAGSCAEAYNIHTQTVSPKNIATTLNAYTCVDITTDFATVLALIAACDLVEFYVFNNDDATNVMLMGVEIVESS